ncbi:kinase [Sphingopyxis bauzanensis]|uniref:Kinase n=1 Tax=Sphingopyxis bauzanensis TaxID=651663 RepID=A0A246K163_9SPHN|nr:HipA domain-containing protein [Sphingopyxis bauzanensis]OWQ99178.1 kinase [Sphingopyxis bauzanensis]GGJ44680.1 kinase [Sphingopyxis bauzanensis]
MPKTLALAIRLHGVQIGTIVRLDGDRTIFAFDPAYIADEASPVLSLSFRSVAGDLLTEHKARKTHLMPFFSNLLPEGMLRRYLARHANISEHAEFDLLAKLGADLPGAITAIPLDAAVPVADVDEGAATNEGASPADQLRFSLAGVQLKFSALENKGKDGGLTIPVGGVGGSWIVKLPSTKHEGVPENEYSMMGIARAIGIDVPETRLLPIRDVVGLPDDIEKIGDTAFAIRRFDRTAEGPVHIEDFAQVFGLYPDRKYDRASYRNILDALARAADLGSAVEFMRRLTFSALIGNGDMHIKNWSLIYPDRRQPLLSPAYDLLSTLPYVPGDDSALKFARVSRFRDFDRDEIAYMASNAGLPEAPLLAAADETVERFMEHWQAEKSHLPLFPGVADQIDRHMETLAILSAEA